MTTDSLDDMLIESENIKELTLRLFQHRGDLSRNTTSNTVSFYDIMPKYVRNGGEPHIITDATETVRTYDFSFEKLSYVIEIEAARIKHEDGTTEYCFPSSQEEIIEDVLRHQLSINQQLSFFEDNIGCQFSIYDIRQELAKHKKTRSNVQVRHSLRVLHKATLSVFLAQNYKNGTGDPIFSGPFFADATVVDPKDYHRRGEQNESTGCKGVVKFHNMVTLGIAGCDFRLLRYDVCMQYKSDMARWLHKRISHRHTAADNDTPYKINMSTIFNDGNWKWSLRMDRNKAKIMTALKEMMKLKQINENREPVFIKVNKDNGAATDYLIEIYLSKEFVDHIIVSNSRNKDVRKAYEQYNSGTPSLPAATDATNEDDLIERLVGYGINKKTACGIVEKYPREQVERNISYSVDSLNRKRQTNPAGEFKLGGFMYKAITEDWAGARDVIPPEEDFQLVPQIPEEPFCELSVNGKKFVEENWAAWDKSSQKSFTKDGLRNPHIKELYEEWCMTA